MRRSPAPSRTCFVALLLSLSLVVDARRLEVQASSEQRLASAESGHQSRDDSLSEQQQSLSLVDPQQYNSIIDYVQSLVDLIERHRNYTEDEERQRKYLRKKKLDVAVKNNVEAGFGKRTYLLRLNKFSDWFDDEYTALLGTKLPKNRLVPPMFSLGTSSRRNTSDWLKDKTPIKYLPPTLNWTASGWVTPVADQGSCASCWAFAACGALEAQLYNQTGTLYNLSIQNIVDCSPPLDADGCKGGVIQWAVDYVTMNDGINTERVYPYVGKLSRRCQFQHDTKLSGIMQSWVDLPVGNETAMLIALKTVGPLAAAVDARPISFQMYSGGVYACSDCTTSINHGVLIVGYGTRRTFKGDLPYWIIKNSWGTSWGVDGYMFIQRNVNMCGIALSATYPAV